MSSIPNPEMSLPAIRGRGLSPVQFAAVGAVLATLGLSTIWFTVISLWTLWTTDALKSIGMVIPLVSLVLVLRAWRSIGWRAEGTWWGLALLALVMVLARVQQQTILMLVISPHWYTLLPPPSLMLMAYGSGVVLLLGGRKLYRAALFPIVLLLFANPIPHAFNVLVDLPLQYVSAHIARAFAISLGQPLTPDHLRLMFTPDFGMFIAPGCNGIRGSVTMGYIALIAGYLYRFRWQANALVVTGAVLLGYVFNLARLCLLVVYYLIALHFPSLQNKAENADYVIGASLFLVATFLLFSVVQHLRDSKKQIVPDSSVPELPSGVDGSSRRQYWHLAALGVAVVLGCAGMARANAATNPYVRYAEGRAIREFPSRLGSYTLSNTWTETASAGPVIYVWAKYVPGDGGTPITVGVSPVLGWHDPLICHFTRGEKPYWQGQLAVDTANHVPVEFNSAFYNDGVTEYFEASTICNGSGCGESATTERTHFGFLYTRPDSSSLLGADARRPVPVVLRVERADAALPSDVAQQQLIQNLRAFLAGVNLDDLARPYSQ